MTSPSSVAINLGEGRTAVAVACGESYTCALLDDGSLKCWGKGSAGQLGMGNTNTVSAPSSEAIDLGADKTATAMACGRAHTCAILNVCHACAARRMRASCICILRVTGVVTAASCATTLAHHLRV